MTTIHISFIAHLTTCLLIRQFSSALPLSIFMNQPNKIEHKIGFKKYKPTHHKLHIMIYYMSLKYTARPKTNSRQQQLLR